MTDRRQLPDRTLRALTPNARGKAEADMLADLLRTITTHARYGRVQVARDGLLRVKAQMLAAQATHEGVTPAAATYADVTHTITGLPRSVPDAFRVGADNVVRAYVAQDYRMALRAVDGLLARLRKFKPQP